MTGDNHELPLLCELRGPDRVADAVIVAFGDSEESAVKEAIAWAWRARRVRKMDKSTAAERCGITRQHFGAIIAGKKYLPPHSIDQFEWVMGNSAVSQTLQRFAATRADRFRRELSELLAQQLVPASRAA